MKRTVLIVIGILLACVSQAHIVPREKAAAAAGNVFKTIRATAGTSGEPRLVKQTRNLYVFENEGGGFAIMSADDVAAPVLAYSETGRFPVNDMPDNMRAMLEWYDRIISFAREQGWETSKAERAVKSNSESAVKLQTAPWGQWHPFNDLSPMVDRQQCPSGCVATAIAIIMRYYKYPEQGTGELPGYDYEYNFRKIHVDGHKLGHKYDWEKMPDKAYGFSDEESAQIAQLLYDIGVMCEMNYAPGGSGASSFCALKMPLYFGYDKSIRFCDRTFYNTETWEKMIRDEIDAGRPVFYTGDSDEGGHAFVVDGYRGDYFSINYGWSEGSGYYLLTPIEGHEDELTEFMDWQDMTIRIMPDQGGAQYVSMVINSSYEPFTWNFQDKTMTAGNVIVSPYSIITGDVDVAYALFDRNGQFRQLVSDVTTLTADGWKALYVPDLTLTLPASIADGDCIKLCLKSEEDWKPLEQTRCAYVQFDRARTLRQMVSVGHKMEARYTRLLLFEMYKDVWWELQSEDGRVLLTSGDIDANSMGPSGPWSIWNRTDILDGDAALVRYGIILSEEQTYMMVIRNFNETMTFTIKM